MSRAFALDELLVTTAPELLDAYFTTRTIALDLEQAITEERASYTALCEDEDEPVSQVTVRRERAMIWQPNWRVLTDRLRRLLAAYNLARECIPGRLWQLGRVPGAFEDDR